MPRSRILTDAQVALLDERRRALGLSARMWRDRFGEALGRDGAVASKSTTRTRLNRVISVRMRCPASEETLIAVAVSLEWSIADLEAEFEGVELVG